MSEARWYFVESGKRQGPVALTSLLERLRAGELPRSALLWYPGLPQWTRAERLPEIRAELGEPDAARAAAAPAQEPGARVEALRARLQQQPHPKLEAQLADALREQGELDEALQTVRNGLERFPTYGALRLALGRVLLAREALEEARAEFWGVLMDNPDNALAERCLGECLERLGDASGARTHYRAALALDRSDAVAKERLSALDSAKRKRLGPKGAKKGRRRARVAASDDGVDELVRAGTETPESDARLEDEEPHPDVEGSEQELELYADTSFTEKALAGSSLPRRSHTDTEASLAGSFADAEDEALAPATTRRPDHAAGAGEPEDSEREAAEAVTGDTAPPAEAAAEEPGASEPGHEPSAGTIEAEEAEAAAALALADATDAENVGGLEEASPPLTEVASLEDEGLEVEAQADTEASGFFEVDASAGARDGPDPLLAIAIEAASAEAASEKVVAEPAVETDAEGFWEVGAEPPPAPPEPADVGPTEGSLANDDVPTLLQRLGRGRWSGQLVVARAGLVKRIALDSGAVVGASSSSPDDGLAERLLLTGSLSLRDYAETARAVGRGGSLVAVLRDKVGEERLAAAGLEVVQAIVFSLFAWTDGSFRLEPDVPPDVEAVGVELRTPELVLDGVRQVYAWSRVERGAGGVTALYERAPLDEAAFAELELPEAARALLDAHQGVKSVAMICRDAPISDFDACQLVWGLRVLGALRPLS